METLHTDVLVIGSGPGGATTAAMLAEAGREVLLAEEGGNYTLESANSYTLDEMDQKYRNGGLNQTFGKTNVTYIEGRCVGGASEINAALYHRPKPETLRQWQLHYQIDEFDLDALTPHFEAIEQEFSVSRRPTGMSPASALLTKGADKLGWKSGEVSRFWKYTQNKNGDWNGRRQSMSETMIPRFLAAGGTLCADTRVRRLNLSGNQATSATAVRNGTPIVIKFRHVFVCCGAVQTPVLLRRSGIKENIGEDLQLHPMIRIAAEFPTPFNDPSWGVPVCQVEAFKPEITLGCSHSSLPHLALWLEGQDKSTLMERMPRLGVFYVAAVGEGRGQIRSLPLIEEPFVRYDVLNSDMGLLGEGLYRLGRLLFAAGAKTLFDPVPGRTPITSPADLHRLRELPHQKLNVTTIHLFSSCPMGEDRRICAVDSFGRLHGYENIAVNDASMLPRSPGVNPQGTILSIARRNVLKLLEIDALK